MFTYFFWWYMQEPIYLWRSISVITLKMYANFSIPLLLSTLFDPWKRDTVALVNASLGENFQVLIQNLISRFIGFFIRVITIFTGYIATILTFAVSILFLVIWLAMPVIILYLIASGLVGIING